MNIGIFTDSYLPTPNGVATAVDRTARALKKRGHHVSIIAPNVPGYKDIQPNIYRLPSIDFFKSGTQFALHVPNKTMYKIAKLDLDIIHAHNGGPISLFAWELAKIKKIPYVFTYWTLLVKYVHYLGLGLGKVKFMRVISKIICTYCDFLIVPTNAIKQELRSYDINKPIHIHPTGIETGKYRNVKKGFIREKCNIEKNQRILLYVGRLGKEKSVDFLIDSFFALAKVNQDSVLVLVGSGNEEAALKAQVKRLGLDKRVHFLGAIAPENIETVYADADVFVFASQTETQGIVVLEALASGLPSVVVSNDVTGEFITDQKNGFVVEKEPVLFANAINTLLTDAKLYSACSQSAYEVADTFTIERTAEYLEKVYTKLLNDKQMKYKKRSLYPVYVDK